MRCVVKNTEAGGLSSGSSIAVSDENVVESTMMKAGR